MKIIQQENNNTYKGLITPKHFILEDNGVFRNIKQAEILKRSRKIRQCAKEYDVVIKRGNANGVRDYTKKEYAGILAAWSIIGTAITCLTGLAQNFNISSPLLLLGSTFGAYMGYLRTGLFKEQKLTPQKYDYTIQAGEKYNQDTQTFEGATTRECIIKRFKDFKNLDDLKRQIEVKKNPIINKT